MWNEIGLRAKNNTEIYKDIFACIPDDSIKKFNKIGDFEATANLEKYDELKQGIKGYAIEFPHRFLENETDIATSVFSVLAILQPDYFAF